MNGNKMKKDKNEQRFTNYIKTAQEENCKMFPFFKYHYKKRVK